MTSLVGRTLDRYEVVDEIGSGAVGRVYLAQDPLIGRLVAIKAFEPTNGGAQRPVVTDSPPALHEARAAGILSHPNIVTIHDVVDRHQETVPFIAMEYVRGTDLKEILSPGRPLPIDFTVSVVTQIAAALDYAHEHGVIHGDVKPANILITAEEQVKITDFGVARKTDEDAGDTLFLMGTPSYVAPEQILSRNVDHRADLFALGVMLHEMLTGRLPYEGHTSEEILHEIAEEPVVVIRSNGAELSPGIERVLTRALQKDPERRYHSAGELAESLRREAASDDAAADESTQTNIIAVAPRPEPLRPRDLGVRLGQQWQRARRRAREQGRELSARLLREWRSVPKTRLALLAAVVLVASSVVVGLAFLAIRSGVPSDLSPGEDHRLRTRYAPHLLEGRRLLSAGEPLAAAAAFERAESIAPQVPAIASLRQRAEREAADAADYAELEARIQDLLDRGEEALARGRRDLARRSAAEVLRLDPERQAARDLAARAESRPAPAPTPRVEPEPRAEARALDLPAAGRREGTSRSGASTAPLRDPVVSPPPARLRVDFFSHVPKGVLTLYSGTDQILRHPFRFVRKSGFMRRKGISGRFEDTLVLPPGETELKIYVSTGSQGAELVAVPLRMEPGRTRLLRVVFDGEGKVTASLE